MGWGSERERGAKDSFWTNALRMKERHSIATLFPLAPVILLAVAIGQLLLITLVDAHDMGQESTDSRCERRASMSVCLAAAAAAIN